MTRHIQLALSLVLALAVALAVLTLPCAPARADEDAGAILLVVADSDGKPIAGAEVGVWNEDDRHDTVTDAAGKAQIQGVAVGEWTAWAAAEKRTGEEQDVEVVAGSEKTITFALSPGIPFSGRVVDTSGAPVAGTYVKAVAGGTFEGYGEMKTRAPYARLFTQDDGSFRVRGIPPGAVSTLVTTADGFRETHYAVRAQGDGVRPSPVQIVLDRGGTVTGRVLDADDRPVADAVVYLVPADAPQLIRNPLVRTWSTDGGSAMAHIERTDAEGRFTASGLAFDEAVVGIAEAPGHARSLPSEPVAPTEKTRTVELPLRLRRATTVAVQLVAPSGEPVTEAVVRIGEAHDGGPAVGEPNGDGAFVLTGLPEGEVELTIEAEGFLEQTARVTTKAGKPSEILVTLDAGAALAGVARDEEGRPLPGVNVSLTLKKTAPNGGWSSRTVGMAKTDSEGRFSFTGLEKAPHELNATVRGNFALPDELIVDPPNTSLELVLRRMGSLRIRFVPPKDGPSLPDRTMVWTWDLDAGHGSGMKQKLDGDVLVLGGGRGLRERVRVSFDEFLPFEREVRVEWGKDIDLGDVKLDPGVTLRGRVATPEGKPLHGALVAWSDQRESVSGDDGSFTLEHVPAGSAEVKVEAEGFLPLTTTVDTGPDGAPPTLTLRRGSLVSGRLVDGAGAPLTDHWIQFRRPPTNAEEPKGEFLDEVGTDDKGEFEIRLVPGPCRVLFILADGINVLATLDLAEGKQEKLTLTLK